MKTIEWTPELQAKLKPHQQSPYTYFGAPGQRHLSKWIYNLDLNKYNILVRKPVDVVNFVTEHMVYTQDKVSHQIPEHWLQNPEEVYLWLFDKRMDDCDGSAITVASILHSIGDTRVRLALGHYGNLTYASASQGMNHAYCLLQKGDNHYKLLDAVGDQTIQWLENADPPSYHTLVSASADGRLWLHNSWAEKWGNI